MGLNGAKAQAEQLILQKKCNVYCPSRGQIFTVNPGALFPSTDEKREYINLTYFCKSSLTTPEVVCILCILCLTTKEVKDGQVPWINFKNYFKNKICPSQNRFQAESFTDCCL